jgi:hypothetical protein
MTRFKMKLKGYIKTIGSFIVVQSPNRGVAITGNGDTAPGLPVVDIFKIGFN